MKKSIRSLLLSGVLALGLFACANAQVTVTATTMACQPLINTYSKKSNYGPEVAKLQNFLNNVNGANLNGLGYFGPVTQQEVKNFQYTYGIKPTGYQHILTTKMINSINCGMVAKKARMIYVAPKVVISTNTSGMISGVTKAPTVTVISKGNDFIKDYASKTIPILTKDAKKPKVEIATNTGLWVNLQKDWSKIQENYKAYLLVFALVLALFWFLRKAATE